MDNPGPWRNWVWYFERGQGDGLHNFAGNPDLNPPEREELGQGDGPVPPEVVPPELHFRRGVAQLLAEVSARVEIQLFFAQDDQERQYYIFHGAFRYLYYSFVVNALVEDIAGQDPIQYALNFFFFRTLANILNFTFQED